MVVRGVQDSGTTLNPLSTDYAGPFRNYADPTHGANVHLADYNGLLKGLTVAGDASGCMTGNATRGEVAQVLFNLIRLRKS